MFPLLVLASVICRFFTNNSAIPRLIWGADPIINNKYWSQALKNSGYKSRTLVYGFFDKINKKPDFDLYISDFLFDKFKIIKFIHRVFFLDYTAFLYAIINFDIFHHPATGGYLSKTPLWMVEYFLLNLANKKVVILPYGSDWYQYSKVIDPSLRQALLSSYPFYAKTESNISKRTNYWVKRADILVNGFMIDGCGRWDVLPASSLSIDTNKWRPRQIYSNNNGRNGLVTIGHTPNHRGFKGTEFIVKAVKDLKNEGFLVELFLIEGIQNDIVRKILFEEVDILAEQLVATAYAMSGVEGMATGLPVLSNLDSETYTRVFRRYSFLNECPILSTTPETIKTNLQALITNPKLRKNLGKAGRHYIEKYHSLKTSQFIFGSIYDRIWHGKDVDLINLFHPLKSQYNCSLPFIDHPLIENRLPEGYRNNA